MENTKTLLKVLDVSLNGKMVFSAVRDPKGHIIDFKCEFVNAKAASLVDRKPSELLGKRLLEVMAENKEHGLFEKCIEVVETGESTSFDIQYEDELLDNWFRIQVVKLEDGFVVTFLDITNLKQIEAELLRKEKLLSEAQDLANLGSWSWNLIENTIQWSSMVYHIFEIDDHKFQPTYDFFISNLHHDDRDVVIKGLNDAVERQQPYEIEFRIVTQNKVKYLEARGIPKVAPDGTLMEYFGAIRDVTEEITQREALRLSEKKSKRMEMVASSERMARSIAHEIRNPLTNIALATEQLRSDVDRESKDLFLDMISRNGHRIEDLIKKLMDSSQQAVLDISDQDINQILDDAVSLAMDRIKLRGVSIKKDYQSQMCSIKVDGEKVKIALLNIIINAIEAVRDNGIIELKTRLTDEECIVEINDNGAGIEQSQMNQLFDPFYTGKKRGLGLGLTTTLNILNSHDANIEVNSTPGEGTSFTLNFRR